MKRWCGRWRSSRTRGSQSLELDRIELADVTGGPVATAAVVHRQLGRLSCAVPVEVIARALDITEIRKELLDGCEGMLLTNRMRSYGKVLVNTRGGPRRTRFSIAHELGHFLLESHKLNDTHGFVCTQQDMGESREKTWIGNPEIELFEQTRLGRDGYAVTLLWASVSEQGADDGGVEELGEPGFHKRRRH